MKSRRRISSKLTYAAAFLSVLFVIYLQVGLLPGKLKDNAVRWIEQNSGKKLRFDKLLYLPFRGLTFTDAQIADEKGAFIFSAKKMAFDVQLIPFFREKKIIISNLLLDTPRYEFLTQPEPIKSAPAPKTKISGQIAVPTLPEDSAVTLSDVEKEGFEAFLPENVYIRQIEVIDGLVTVRQKKGSPVLETIRNIDLRLGFHKPPFLFFDGSFELGEDPYATFSLEGRWNLNQGGYDFHWNANSKKVPAWLVQYQRKNAIVLHEARFTLDGALKSIDDQTALFSAEAGLKDARVSLKSMELAGHMRLAAKGLFNFSNKSISRYMGKLEFLDVHVSNLSPAVRELRHVQAEIGFRPGLLDMESLKGHYDKVAFAASGSLESFENLIFRLQIHADSDATDMLALLPAEHKRRLEGFEITGQCQSLTTLEGSLKDLGQLRMENKLTIREGRIQNKAKKISLSEVRAEIDLNDSGILVSNATAVSNEENYALELQIPKDAAAPGRFSLASKKLELAGSYFLNGDVARIEQASVKIPGLTAQVKGRLIHPEDPFLEIEGQAEIDLARLGPTLLPQVPAFKDWKLKGTLAGYFTLKGPWNRPLDWELNADMSGPLFVNKLALQNFEIQLRMRDRIANLPYMRSLFYGGIIGGSAVIDLARSTFEGRVSANHVSLRALIQDLPEVKQKDLSGTCFFQTSLKGLMNVPETLAGGGAVDIRDGNLWRSSLFKQMGEIPFVKITGLDLVVFSNLSATFEIRDKRVWTDNCNLFGSTVNLSLKGSIGFDRSLDFLMWIRYSGDVLRGAFETGGLVPFLVQQAEDFISQYKITGNLQEPKFEKAGFVPGRVVGRKISNVFQALAQ